MQAPGMANKDIVVIGASAGGMTALETLVASLPADLPAAVFVVLHLAPGVSSVLSVVSERLRSASQTVTETWLVTTLCGTPPTTRTVYVYVPATASVSWQEPEASCAGPAVQRTFEPLSRTSTAVALVAAQLKVNG